jgi:hypothetical protein
MTMPRLAILIAIGIVAIDYKLNDARLVNDLRDTMAQWGCWLDEHLSNLARKLAPA